MNSLGDFLVLNANRYPKKTAIVYGDQRISYQELNQRVNRMAHHLLDMGIQKGDRIGLFLKNSNQFVEILFASFKIGAIVSPLSWRMIPRELKWCADNTGCKVLVYGQDLADVVNHVKSQFETVEKFICSGKTAPAGEFHFEAMTSSGDDSEPLVKVHEDDLAHIFFTGGTTGVMKAPVHTHRASVMATYMQMMLAGVTSDYVAMFPIPMYHVGGLSIVKQSIAAGGKMVFTEEIDEPKILRLIEQERVTQLTLLPPQIYFRLVNHPSFKDFDTSSVKYIATSVGAFPKHLMLRLLDGFPNARILFGYGQTEIMGAATNGLFGRSDIEQERPSIKGIGTELPFTEVRLVDFDGREVPIGETGEAAIRGSANMVGYWNQPELTAEIIKDGWVHTGDLLRKDADGHFYFMGRKKDMIKTGGENVYAEEVEKIIFGHPSVDICAVIGLPDRKFFESVTAVVKLKQDFTVTEEELVEHCKQFLSSYKKPRKVIFLDKFPMTDAGKIQKYKLREMFANINN